MCQGSPSALSGGARIGVALYAGNHFVDKLEYYSCRNRRRGRGINACEGAVQLAASPAGAAMRHACAPNAANAARRRTAANVVKMPPHLGISSPLKHVHRP